MICCKISYQCGSLTGIKRNCLQTVSVDCVWNVMAHAQKPDSVFRRNGRVHLNRRGRQFSRLLAAEVCASAVVMLDTPCFEVVKGTGYPLHSPVSPSLPLPCVTVCHHISTGLYRPSSIRFASTFTKLHTKLDAYPLLQILVTHFSANRIPQTRTTSSAARERTTHLVCGSCKRKLEHVQTCLNARVCLTQHPSDTLRLFRELNCRTS